MPHIQFDTAMTASTPYYPSNGFGGYSATASDSMVSDWTETELTGLSVPGSAAAQIIEIVDGDGETAFTTTVLAQSSPWSISWDAGRGPLVRGAWHVNFPDTTSTTDFWLVQFERVR